MGTEFRFPCPPHARPACKAGASDQQALGVTDSSGLHALICASRTHQSAAHPCSDCALKSVCLQSASTGPRRRLLFLLIWHETCNTGKQNQRPSIILLWRRDDDHEKTKDRARAGILGGHKTCFHSACRATGTTTRRFRLPCNPLRKSWRTIAGEFLIAPPGRMTQWIRSGTTNSNTTRPASRMIRTTARSSALTAATLTPATSMMKRALKARRTTRRMAITHRARLGL